MPWHRRRTSRENSHPLFVTAPLSLPSHPVCRCNADADGNTPAGYVEGKSYCSNYDIKDPTDCTDADNTWVTLPGAGEGPLRDGTDQTTPDVRCAPYHALCS
eukprot:scaffold110176_cov32-Phaeocystis_antarctica.AAC.2